MSRKKEAVIYTRHVSQSIGQTNVINQLRQCKAYAAHHGLKVVAQFHDESDSDLEKIRPALADMFEMMAQRENLNILIHSTENLAIHSTLRAGLLLLIGKFGANLIVVSEW